MARQLLMAATVGASAGVALTLAFRAGAWVLGTVVDTYFRVQGWRETRRERDD